MDWISVRLAWITKQLGAEPTNSHIPNTPFIRKDGQLEPFAQRAFGRVPFFERTWATSMFPMQRCNSSNRCQMIQLSG